MIGMEHVVDDTCPLPTDNNAPEAIKEGLEIDKMLKAEYEEYGKPKDPFNIWHNMD